MNIIEENEPEPIERLKIKLKFKIQSKQIVENKKIVLFDSQKTHVDNLVNILKNSNIALDLSMLGTGKTYTSSYISLMPEMDIKHMIVICPLSIKGKWEFMKKEFGVPLYDVITYCKLRSSKCNQPKHDLLYRRDYKEKFMNHQLNQEEFIDKVEFTTTSQFDKLNEERILLIVDEIQNIKNNVSQYHACHAMIKKINMCNTGSKVILLSGSPIDKQEQVINYFKLIDIYKSKGLSEFNPYTGINRWTGMKEIYNYMNNINPKLTDKLCYLRKDTGIKTDFIYIIYSLFQSIYKKKFTSSMPPFNNNFNITKENAFYSIYNYNIYNIIDDQNKINKIPEIFKLNSYNLFTLLKKGITKLITAISFNNDTQQIIFFNQGSSFSQIQTALLMIETAKLPNFLRIAIDKLNSNPNLKIIICLNYLVNLNDLYNMFKILNYNILLLTGSVSDSNRKKIISQFQEHNNLCRILIGNTSVCSSGIDLDDQHGDYPRFCMINPNYSTITLYQVSHRIYRQCTKSDSNVQFVYAKELSEMKILMALAKKSKIMKQTTNYDNSLNIKFPCDYDMYVEESNTLLDQNIINFYNQNYIQQDHPDILSL